MFIPYSPNRQHGKLQRLPALGAPPGTTVPANVAELLRDMTTQLGLSDAGVFTPWAVRTSDLQWEEVKNPDTNIALFGIDDRQINLATSLMYGQPLPFLTIRSVTPAAATKAQLENALEGSAYELYEVDAVYDQFDNDEVPIIWYLYWVRHREQSGSKTMEAVARELNGSVYFAQQVPVEGTTRRAPPSVSFEQAHGDMQPPVSPTPEPSRPVPALPKFPVKPRDGTGPGFNVQPDQKVSYVGPIVLGLFVAAGTIAFLKAAKS